MLEGRATHVDRVPSIGGAATKVGGILAHDGTWSPDGQSIVYASGHELFITSNEGRNPRTLASVPGRAFWLRYSPDGRFIRFTVLDPATRATSLWQISADETGLRPSSSRLEQPGDGMLRQLDRRGELLCLPITL
jgi:WD40 repeat protein